mgnify:CR=1 FL=1
MYMKFYSVRTVLFCPRSERGYPCIDGSNDRRASCCVHRIRGNVDLIEEGVGGYLVAPGEESEYRIAFTKLYEMKKNEPQKFEKTGQANQCKIKEFSKENVDEIMKKVYQV